jgi:anti-anti-sigma regulatory factor
MSELFIEALPFDDGTGTTFRLEGVLDREGSSLLRDQVLAAPHRVAIDFAQLRSMPDSALGILASGLAARPNVKLVGLPHHAERILRAFGVTRVA